MSLVAALHHNARSAESVPKDRVGPVQLGDVMFSTQQTLVGSVVQQCLKHKHTVNTETVSQILHSLAFTMTSSLVCTHTHMHTHAHKDRGNTPAVTPPLSANTHLTLSVCTCANTHS